MFLTLSCTIGGMKEASASKFRMTEAQAAKAYDAYRADHGRMSNFGSLSYAARLRLFTQRAAEVDAQNDRPHALWKAAVNKFTDSTDAELQSMLGFRRLGRWWVSGSIEERSFLQEDKPLRQIADTVDFRTSLNSSQYIRNQGACGSCWAVAAVGALEAHAELSSKGKPVPKLSHKQLIDCVPNPQHCGGDGGCAGATAELAFAYVSQSGLSSLIGYVGDDESTERCKAMGNSMAIQTKGFVKLPVNRLQPLLDAVSNEGPVVVSVDGSPWSSYSSGIFDSCSIDATVNHAVLLMGYGHDSELGQDYWLLRNSWGSDWGEDGYIRLLRHSSDKGKDGFCGTDYDPKQGAGCDGGPKTIPVCGMCGVLSDSSYPTSVKLL